ncbi:hypothetical protein GGD92_04760 [Pseudomonas protegens]|uniref:Uncharacterized protein n=1 Tax=Pseudomonas protegens TaxID=380021 RepID=A0A7G8YPI2_9PSED|nr:hypothetical protein [Pseudomonas protegens]QNH77580.1 hypothetical protein GGI48_30895 [Pseudomonas protegens]QNL06776.1 hypothetical protein GGD92_04760 [Pseudomonas protegens]
MTDRMVLTADGRVAAFSTFQGATCLVLLGDPGAGKSHLFDHWAGQAGGRAMSLRGFLLRDPALIAEGSTLFIDALDEHRAQYGERPAFDDLIRHLGRLPPCRVRIACRSADWAGLNDLKLLSSCFPGKDQVQELRLLALSDEEQQQVLEQHGRTPEDFLHQARQRGLGEMLGNPLTLLMLAQVVAQDHWPLTRRELFERSSILLLDELNAAHRDDRQPHAQLSEPQMLEAAGLLCALRLLADIDGFSTDERYDRRYPALRKLHAFGTAALRAALASRVFTSTREPGVFDYGHKASAEYLAARYLAGQFHAGLPLSRIRLLLGVEGKPASYLRGVHAWLAVFLGAQVGPFIEADPYGVLVYGDAASLSTQSKIQLLQALASLALADPRFRGQEPPDLNLAGFTESGLVPCFQHLLSASGLPHELRLLLLDLLRAGQPLPAMLQPLTQLLADPGTHLNERAYAAQALSRLGEPGTQAVRQVYRNLLDEKHARSLCGYILRHRLAGQTHYGELLELYRRGGNAPRTADDSLMRWGLHEAVAESEMADCLDGMAGLWQQTADEHAKGELLRFVLRLLVRYLHTVVELDEPRLLQWLAFINAGVVDPHPWLFNGLRAALRQRPETALGLLDRAASHPGLVGCGFLEDEPPSEDEPQAEAPESDYPCPEEYQPAVAALYQQLQGAKAPLSCDALLLGFVIFGCIEQQTLAGQAWFSALRQAQYADYIDCIVLHFLLLPDSVRQRSCLSWKASRQIALADKLDVVFKVLNGAESLDKTALYDVVRPLCRDLDPPRFVPCIRQLLSSDAGLEHRAFLITLGLLLSLEEFAAVLHASDTATRNEVVWYLRDLTGLVRGFEGPMELSADQAFCFCRLLADQYPATPLAFDWFAPSNTRAEDADEFMAGLISYLASKGCDDSRRHLRSLQGHSRLASWAPYLNHALLLNDARRRDARHIRHGWEAVAQVLSNGLPGTIEHMQALVLDELQGIAGLLRSNLDVHKFFWNEIKGRISTPKWEESCRDVLLSLLRPRLEARHITAEPEAHMAHDKRVDIAVQSGPIKLVIELKRSSHKDVWSAIQDQLMALYTPDPGARGHGIYGVFWHGPRAKVRADPGGVVPQSAAQMLSLLEASIPEPQRPYIKVFVLDVSGN